ncbi:hypothetical protein WN55_09929 [Dufourea novaeangliae]|uniref:Uncharacterized protein n=1 Tax=Dufourea novaeangliae TaxID=178035 RepID=A0A154P7P2_DUFNO|nr:hypothetical protein WN55_09929 [Dufourea novaeangliae]
MTWQWIKEARTPKNHPRGGLASLLRRSPSLHTASPVPSVSRSERGGSDWGKKPERFRRGMVWGTNEWARGWRRGVVRGMHAA